MSATTAITMPGRLSGHAGPGGQFGWIGSRGPERAAAPVAVYLRRWAAVIAVVAAVLLAVATAVPRLALAGGGATGATGDAAVLQPAAALVEHRVVPGDTLWDLAVQSSAGEDPRSTVDRIMRLNGMQAPVLQVGEVVLLPNAG